MDLLALSNDDSALAELVGDDWLSQTVHGHDLTEFHEDDAIAASLAALSGHDDDDPMGFVSDRQSTRGSSMRTSFSMNDLQALQHQSAPLWNNKLVSAKPKLQPVPESGPCNGGPLNLMPLPHAMTTPDVLGDNHLIPGLDDAMDEFADFDSEVPEGLHKHLPSTGSLAQQLQMTHVGSNHNLAALEQQSQQQQAAGFSSSALQGQMTHDMSAGGAEAGASAASGHNKPSGLPLRKSQSALELSSWRSFGGLDELWDAENGALDPALAWKLTPEERMQRIQRYREKRLSRNFNPAVKYQCRKSLADTRPRVRGRFARRDDAGIVLPHESKKALRERDRAHSSSTDGLSSDQTSSGGPGGSSSAGRAAAAAALAGGLGGNMAHASVALGMGGAAAFGQGATSPLSGVFTSPPVQSMHVALSPHSASAGGGLRRNPSFTLPDGSTSSALTSLPGISVIGATPEPLLQPELGALGGLGGPSGGGLLPPLAPSAFASNMTNMPPVIGPSSTPGGLYRPGMGRSASLGSYTGSGSPGFFPNSIPPYMAAGQTIFSGQTIFTVGNSSAGQKQQQAAGGGGQQGFGGGGSPDLNGGGPLQLPPVSVTTSAGPLMSLPLQPISPAASDTHSNNLSIGLSLGDISSL